MPLKKCTELAHKRRIKQVTEYIEQHLSENINLDLLATVAHLSPFHFHRTFKYHVGENINEFIKRQRMERAASLLVDTDNAVTSIGQQVGYRNPAAFCRAFKLQYSLSPTEFRQVQRARANGRRA